MVDVDQVSDSKPQDRLRKLLSQCSKDLSSSVYPDTSMPNKA